MRKIDFCQDWLCDGKPVAIPHDAMLEAGRDPASSGGSAIGYYVGTKAVYEKRFHRPAAKHVAFLFEGVYRKAEVRINDKLAGGCAYGYSEFVVWADEYLVDGENTITVIADNSETPNSRWYSGTGIYRPVWLLTAEDNYIKPNGIWITTCSIDPVQIQVGVDAVGVEPAVQILDGETAVCSGVPGIFTLPDANLWSAEHPHLYRCRVTAGEDSEEVTFGIREITKDQNGLYVNGEPVLLRGGCVHHDNGILGACAYKEAEWRKVRMLKEAGFNAIRSAHNPCSRALLDACDHYGMYVMDESWDMWYQRKNKFDYGLDFAENWRFDLKSMVTKDRNHPCVIFYSIGNEVSEPASDKGLALAKEITEYLHSLDNSRFVTGGYNLMHLSRAVQGLIQYSENAPDTTPMNSSLLFNKMAAMIGTGMNNSSGSEKIDKQITPLMDVMDVAGYNYASGRYEKDAVLHPNRIIIGTETFPQDIVKNWRMVERLPTLVGDFMWTAWDYLGEAGIGAWAYTADGRSFNKPYPWLLADVGAIDLLGNPTAELYMAQAAWHLLKQPKIAVQPVNYPGVKVAKQTWRGTNAIPSWSWKDCDGNKAVVEVYTEAERVALYLNGKLVGEKKTKDCCAVFHLRYVPGKLEAITVDELGVINGRCTLESAEAAYAKPFFEKRTAVPGELLFVPIHIQDDKGNVESNADRKIKVQVENGQLIALGSANPRTEEGFLSDTCTTYYGYAMAVVRTGDTGIVTVTVTDESGTNEACIPVLETEENGNSSIPGDKIR